MPRFEIVAATICLAMLTAAAALAQSDEGRSPSGRPWSEAVAELDGQAITRGDLARFLVTHLGNQWLRALTISKALRQEAQERGVAVSPEDLEAWLEEGMQRDLDRLARQHGLSAEEYREALDESGHDMGAIRAEWRRMHAFAAEEEMLAERLVRDGIEIPESRLREAYQEKHGPRLRVRHIEVADVGAAMEALQALDRGASFERLAEETTLDRRSRAHNYEMRPPPAPDSAVGRRAATLRPGQRAIVRDGERVHVIELIERTAGGEVPFEEAREAIRGELALEEARRRRSTLVADLLERRSVRIVLDEAPPRWDAPVAHVGGETVLLGELAEGLIRDFGREYLGTLLRWMLVNREARRRGVQLDDGVASRAARQMAAQSVEGEAAALGMDWDEYDAMLRERGTSLENRLAGLSKERLPKIITRLMGLACLRQDIEVSEDEVRAEFRRRHAARSRARQVVVKRREDAEEALRLLERGASFAELAEHVSLDAATSRQGGAFEVRKEGLLGETLAEMRPGERRILQVGNLWHLVEKTEDIPERPGNFAELREQVREELLHRKATREYEFWIRELEAKADVKWHLD